MKAIKKLLPKTRIGKSILALMSGTAAAQAITAASMPIVTRVYTPEMIGIISVYLSFFNFWLSMLSWRYESALLIAKDEDESHHIFRLGALLTCFTAFLSMPVMYSLQYFSFLGFGVLPNWTPFVGFLSLLGYGWFMLYRSWLLRLKEAKVISLSAVARSSSNVISRIIMGILNFGVYGLLFAEIVGSWFALGAVRKKTKKMLQGRIPNWSRERVKIVAIRYKKFAVYEMPSTLLNQLAIALPVPIIGALYGAEAAGWFGMARLLYAIPNGQIGKAAGDVFQMELGSYVRNKYHKKAESLFYKFSIRLALFGLIPLALSITLAPLVVPYVFGKAWQEMGFIVALISPWMFMSLVVGSMSRALSVFQKQQWKLIYDITALTVVISLYLSSDADKIDMYSFISFLSAGMVVSYILYFVIILLAVKNFSKGRNEY